MGVHDKKTRSYTTLSRRGGDVPYPLNLSRPDAWGFRKNTKPELIVRSFSLNHDKFDFNDYHE